MGNASTQGYTTDYFAALAEGYPSAKAGLDALWQYYVPESVVDVGCGSGTWLKAALDHGVKEIKGLDGAWVNKEAALVPFERIQIADLSLPFTVDRTFDLAISLEVAEHLPAASAPDFVRSLTRLAPVILFSAAIPRQFGTNHINTQWPAYWAKLFRAEGYVAVDVMRKHLWNDTNVHWWYAQNTVLYIKEAFLHEQAAASEAFRPLLADQVNEPLPLVHPLFLERAFQPNILNVLLDSIPGSIYRAVQKRLPKG